MKRGPVFQEKISAHLGVTGQNRKKVGKSLDNTNNLDSQNTLIKIVFQKICNTYSADILFILSMQCLYTYISELHSVEISLCDILQPLKQTRCLFCMFVSGKGSPSITPTFSLQCMSTMLYLSNLDQSIFTIC